MVSTAFDFLRRLAVRARLHRRARREEAVRTADLLQATLGAMTQGLLVWSADQRFLTCNRRLMEILELPPDVFRPDLTREAFVRLLADRGEFGPGDPTALAAQRIAAIAPERIARDQRMRPDGRVLDIVCTRMRDGSTLMTYTDVTAARCAETALRESEERFRKLSEASQDGILVHDRGLVVDVNRAAASMLGHPAEELLGREVLALIAPEDRDLVRERFRLQMETPFELATLRADGSRITVQGETRYVQYRGRRMGMVSFRDVTEQRRNEAQLRLAKEQAEQASQAKSEFLRMISHEIRTPMNGVLGMIDLLLDGGAGEAGAPGIGAGIGTGGGLSEEQRGYAHTARESAEALLSILNDILDISKMEAGKLSVEARRFNLVEVVEGAVALHAARAAAKRIELAVCVPAGVPALLRGDAGRLRQVLLNLVGNAVKFTEDGGVAVSVALEEDGAGAPADAPAGAPVDAPVDVCLRFDVADTGIGIPAGARPDIFTEFAQVHPHLSRRHGGAGLGLAISKRLVELMGGRIGFESTPGHGSRFWFTLPLARDPESPAAASPPLAGCRLLLLEPNAVSRDLLARQLRSWGAEVNALAGLDSGDPVRGLAPFDGAVIGGGSWPTVARLAHRLRAAGASRIVWLNLAGQGYGGPPPEVDAALLKPARQEKLLAALTGGGGEPAAEAPLGPMPAEPDPPPGRRILLVEDSPTNQRVAAGLLRTAGHRVEIAENGLDALRALQTASFDLVLMDLAMPEMDGLAATRALRALPPPMGTVPVIAMTANAMESDRERCLAAGMNDHIIKPLDRPRLLAMVARWLPVAPDHPAMAASLDAGVLERLSQDLTPELLAEVIRQFVEEVLQRSLRMEERDIPLAELRREAHTLKSTAATFGAMPLAEAAGALEQACRNRGDDGAGGGAGGEVERLRRIVPRLVEEAVAAFRREGYLAK